MNDQHCEQPELAGEELVSHTFLDYINGILMDEILENHSTSQLLNLQTNHAYRLIFDGFHDILMNDKAPSVHVSPLFARTQPGHRGHDVKDGLNKDDGSFAIFNKAVVVHANRDRMVMPSKGFTCGRERDSQISMPAITDEDQSRAMVLGKAQDEHVSFVMNAQLAAEHHAHLFDEWQARGTDKETLLEDGARANVKRKGRDDTALGSAVDIKALLLSGAKAIGEGNTKKAMELLQQVQREGASPHGTGLQRVAHYFREAMVARMSGVGSTLYTAIASTSQLPSMSTTLKAYKMVFEVCPYLKIAHYFANQYILKVATGASRLHIVDYGIFYGFQWPCLIYALAHRSGGPPSIRITGIELPTKAAEVNPFSTTEGTGRRLAEYAKAYNVPFEYRAISVDNWEDIHPSSLHISLGEILVLNSFNRLRHFHNESDDFKSLSTRDRLLQQMRSLNPHLLVTGFMNASHCSPFFVHRFREALHYYCNKFDTLHTIVYEDTLERDLFEREVMGRAILNVVACEGIKRVERPEVYKQWQARIQKAGFRLRHLIPSVLSTSKAIMKGYHKDFSLLQDSDAWILLGWRGRVMQALSAWEPATL